MKILIWGRRAGKTTECIKTLRQNPDACMFVLTTDHKHSLPKEVQARIFSYHSKAWRGRHYTKAIFDEPDAGYIDDKLLEELTQCFEVILVATSLDKSYDDPCTWLRKQIKLHGYDHKVSPDSDKSKPHISERAIRRYETEYLAKFKEKVKK